MLLFVLLVVLLSCSRFSVTQKRERPSHGIYVLGLMIKHQVYILNQSYHDSTLPQINNLKQKRNELVQLHHKLDSLKNV